MWKRSKLSVIYQSESAECGLACLAMLANYHGHSYSLSELRRLYPTGSRGINLSRMIEIANSLKLKPRPVRLELEHINRLKLPCVLHWDFNHFIVLSRFGKQGAIILDPAIGIRSISMAELSDRFTGVAIEFSTAVNFTPEGSDERLSIRSILRGLSNLKSTALTLILLAFSLEFVSLLNPLYLQFALDKVVGSSDLKLLIPLAIVFSGIIFLNFILLLSRSWIIIRIGSKLNEGWLSVLYSHLIRLPYTWYETRNRADILSRFGSIKSIQSGLAASVLSVLLDGFTGFFIAIVLLCYSIPMGSAIISGFFLYTAIKFIMFARLRQATSESVLNNALQQHELVETLTAILPIKINNKQDARDIKYRSVVSRSMAAEIVAQRITALSTAVNQCIILGFRMLAVSIGSYLILSDRLTSGMLLAFLVYSDMFMTRSMSFIDKLTDLRLLKFHMDRIADLFSVEKEHHNPQAPLFSLETYDLICINLSYRYTPSAPWVLRNVSFHIRTGESVVIVGASGCGKSTLAKIILGIFTQNEGTLTLDGNSLQSIGLDNYRSLFGTVLQEDKLLTGSVFDNISFFDPNANFIAVQTAAKIAVIDSDIKKMPMGYHTFLGDMGMALSGGQTQRILLARALYKNPKILILDEATSHLNVELERLVNSNIKDLNITRIIIAHRPETIASADRIIDLVNDS